MSFDGSGNYTPSASGYPAVAGTTITASFYNAAISDLATALSNCLTRDGQGKPSANIDWNGKNLTNAALFSCTNNATVGGTLSVTGTSAFTGKVTANGGVDTTALTLTTALGTTYGGTGVDAHLASNGQLLIGNGTGFTLATLTAGAGISITNVAGGITITATGGGGGSTTSFPLTFASDGTGAAALTTFNGSAARTISYNSIGAKPLVPQLQIVVTSPTSITPTFSNDGVILHGANGNITLNNWSGTAIDSWGLTIRLYDDGIPRTITYGTKYRAIGVTLPTVTVANKHLYLGVIYNLTRDTFDVVSVAQET